MSGARLMASPGNLLRLVKGSLSSVAMRSRQACSPFAVLEGAVRFSRARQDQSLIAEVGT